jgi:uncharacterized protein (TIGR02001 family)
MNKKLLLALASALAGSTSLLGQTSAPAPAAAPSVAVTATAAFATDYMFRGQRLQGPSFQPTVEMAAGNLTLGVWGNFPIKDEVPGSSDPEIDPYGSYTIPVNAATSIVPGFTVYTYPNADKSAGWYKTTIEPNLALNYTVSGLKLTPKVYYDFVLEGAVYEFTAFYAAPLKEMGTELDFTATYGTYKFDEFAENSSPSTKAWGNYWLIGVAMPFQIAPNQKITLGVAYTEGSDAYTKLGTAPRSPNAGAMDKIVGSIAYSFTF